MIISRGGHPLPVLGRFESVSEYTLPADYRDWMVQHNGGYLTADLPMPHPGGDGVVNQVHSAEHLWERWHNRASDYFPEGYLAVAGSGNGGSVCLDLRTGQDGYGQVYWCDDDLGQQTLAEGQKSESVMVPLSPDWATFASNI